MFRSKRRAIVIPQSEHLRLVGTLALLWGNADFDAPPIERRSLVLGAGSHDRGYGPLDNHAIGAMTPEEWNEIARRSFELHYWDIVADTITKFHVRRLASHDESDERRAMTREFSQKIDAQLQRFNLSRDLFARLDRITELCDRISFDFCFEEPASGTVMVLPHNAENQEVAIEYRVEDGVIHAIPWPFSAEHHESYIVAYAAAEYPDKLEPVIIPCLLERT